ncbi:hypothetical protein J3A83DRAFT_4193395 [Scleroderma citrinum]
MWKQFGTKVVIVVAWKDTKGKLMAGMDDFNDELEDGTAFPEWESIQDKWSSYATDVFDTKEIVDGEEINKGVGGNRRVQKGKKRPPVAPPTLEDGTPQIPNILDMHASEKDIISKVKFHVWVMPEDEKILEVLGLSKRKTAVLPVPVQFPKGNNTSIGMGWLFLEALMRLTKHIIESTGFKGIIKSWSRRESNVLWRARGGHVDLWYIPFTYYSIFACQLGPRYTSIQMSLVSRDFWGIRGHHADLWYMMSVLYSVLAHQLGPR